MRFTCYTEQLFIVSEHNFTKCNILACKLYRNIWKCNHQSYNLMASITQTTESLMYVSEMVYDL